MNIPLKLYQAGIHIGEVSVDKETIFRLCSNSELKNELLTITDKNFVLKAKNICAMIVYNEEARVYLS